MNVITAVPSKSYEQRVLAGILLSGSVSEIKNSGNSDDVITTRNIIKELGNPQSLILNCNESAFCARLFASIACLL